MRTTRLTMRAAALPLLLAGLCGATGAAAKDLKTRQLEDLDSARQDYVLASKAYSAGARARALAAIDAARSRAGTLSEAELAVVLARAAALADNAHDGLSPNFKLFGQHLPLRMAWVGTDLMVVLSGPQLPELAGALVLEIGGKKVEELPAIAHELQGGPEQYARSTSTWLWEFPQVLAALGFHVDHGRVHATFRLRDGQVVERTLDAVDNANVPQASITELLRGARLAAPSGEAWHSARLGAPVPLYMQEPEKMFRAIALPAYDTLYVQFRGNYDRSDGRELGKFAGDTAALAMKLHPRFIVIDQRFNVGGNTDLTRELMKVLGTAARDKVYIFTSEYTFSAGIASTAIAKQAAGAKARLVGAPVGDRLRWWSESPRRCLPNSGHCLSPTMGLWDLRKGCAKEDSCFGDNYEVKVAGLEPDIAAPLTPADWLAGYDAALMAAAADAAQSTQR